MQATSLNIQNAKLLAITNNGGIYASVEASTEKKGFHDSGESKERNVYIVHFADGIRQEVNDLEAAKKHIQEVADLYKINISFFVKS